MNKDDIKKALECCSNPSINSCKDCPYANNGKFSCRDGEMFKDTLDLVTKQENEIDRLKIQLEQANAGIVNCDGYELDEINVVKEFAEKLKEKALSHCRVINCYELTFIETTINDLLKEYEK